MRQGIDLVGATRAKPGSFTAPGVEDLNLLFPEFEILGRLGQGGMGAVYKAIQRDLDRAVAIKILPPEIAADAEFTERFRREASALAQLDHANIVKLFDYGQRESFAYFVMEFVDGVDLSRKIAAGPTSLDEALHIVDQLCDALQHSHERGVVHRDVKPANILMTGDGRVKVADFGLARLVCPEAGDLGLTRSHAALGTPRYMAPEQLAGASGTDHRVDVYALGVVLYELLTGQIPAGHFDPPSEKVPTLNPRIDEVVLRALSAEPNRRFSTALEVKSSLREAIAKPMLTRQERARTLAWRVFAVSLVAALLGAGGALFWAARDRGATDKSVPETRPAGSRSAMPAGRLIALGDAGTMAFPAAGETAVAVALAAAQDEFGLALRADGTVRAWGANRFGQTNVPAGLGGVIAIAAGQGNRSAHALALRSDGTVVGWGDNTFQQANPPDGLREVVAIAAGELHSLALTRAGRVVAWGNPGRGAIAVPDALPPAQAIAAGGGFSLALLKDARVVAWGANDFGQCEPPSPHAPVVEIAAGARHGLARLRDGRVVAWGDNRAGQCNVPTALPPVAGAFAGGEGSAAIDLAGKLHVWGRVPGGGGPVSGRVIAGAIGRTTSVVLVVDPAAAAR